MELLKILPVSKDIFGLILIKLDLDDALNLLMVNRAGLASVGLSNVWYIWSPLNDETINYRSLCAALENNSIIKNNIRLRAEYGRAYYCFKYYFTMKHKYINLYNLVWATKKDLKKFRVVIKDIYNNTSQTDYGEVERYKTFRQKIRSIQKDLSDVPSDLLREVYVKGNRLFEYIIFDVHNLLYNFYISSTVGIYFSNKQREYYLCIPRPWVYLDDEASEEINDFLVETILPMYEVDFYEDELGDTDNLYPMRDENPTALNYGDINRCKSNKSYADDRDRVYSGHDDAAYDSYRYFNLIKSRFNLTIKTEKLYEYTVTILETLQVHIFNNNKKCKSCGKH